MGNHLTEVAYREMGTQGSGERVGWRLLSGLGRNPAVRKRLTARCRGGTLNFERELLGPGGEAG
jgi:hypothetical protein